MGETINSHLGEISSQSLLVRSFIAVNLTILACNVEYYLRGYDSNERSHAVEKERNSDQKDNEKNNKEMKGKVEEERKPYLSRGACILSSNTIDFEMKSFEDLKDYNGNIDNYRMELLEKKAKNTDDDIQEIKAKEIEKQKKEMFTNVSLISLWKRTINHPECIFCSGCWNRKENCFCNTIECDKFPDLPLQFIIYMHYKEYLRASNTGRLLTMLDSKTRIYLCGLPSHEEALLQYCSEHENDTIILYPHKDSISVQKFAYQYDTAVSKMDEGKKGKEDIGIDSNVITRIRNFFFNTNNNSSDINRNYFSQMMKGFSSYLSLIPMLAYRKRKLYKCHSKNNANHNHKRKLSVILCDGTWKNAKSLHNMLPENIHRVRLNPHFGSLFALRTNRGKDKISTFEAATLFLAEILSFSRSCPDIDLAKPELDLNSKSHISQLEQKNNHEKPEKNQNVPKQDLNSPIHPIAGEEEKQDEDEDKVVEKEGGNEREDCISSANYTRRRSLNNQENQGDQELYPPNFYMQSFYKFMNGIGSGHEGLRLRIQQQDITKYGNVF